MDEFIKKQVRKHDHESPVSGCVEEALYALLAEIEKGVVGSVYDWPRSTDSEYSGVDSLLAREIVANQIVERLRKMFRPSEPKGEEKNHE